MTKISLKQLPFWTCVALCLTPLVNSPFALILGFVITYFKLIPTYLSPSKITKKLLAYSVVGLGFGIHFKEALMVTSNGIGLILATIIGTILLGYFLTKYLGVQQKTGYLIASGTSICGGSAIAAIAPAIDAKDDEIALALASIFILNSIALFIFPLIGHAFSLDQVTFGTWAAIAIHDTSSVVGAASAYGEEALKIATTLKLTRALWIIPIAFFSAFVFGRESKKMTLPYFIFFYCLAILVSDFLPQFETSYQFIFNLSKQTLVLCLFLIGCSISIDKIKQAGPKPMILATVLWILISTLSLLWLL